MNMQIKSICVALALVAAPLTAQAVPVTYDIGSGSAPNFSGSWLHAATNEMGSTGYYANGQKIGLTGTLTLDMGDLAAASGELTGTGNFGLGSDSWTIDFLGGASTTDPTFVGGKGLLLSLDYELTSAGHSSFGTFYFADHDFNNTPNDGSANFINPNNLVLWGNNWINDGINNHPGESGLGLDLFGTARADVPEPGVLALLAMGLVGMGVSRRKLRS